MDTLIFLVWRGWEYSPEGYFSTKEKAKQFIKKESIRRGDDKRNYRISPEVLDHRLYDNESEE